MRLERKEFEIRVARLLEEVIEEGEGEEDKKYDGIQDDDDTGDEGDREADAATEVVEDRRDYGAVVGQPAAGTYDTLLGDRAKAVGSSSPAPR